MENDEFPYKFFLEDLPPEYQAWYLSHQSGQSSVPSHPSEAFGQAEESWSPFLGTSRPLASSFGQATSSQASQQPPETPSSYSNPYEQKPTPHQETWNYMYYLHLLSESQQRHDSSERPGGGGCQSGPAESTLLNSNMPVLTLELDSVSLSRPETPIQSTSLYSTMLKKGLKSLPKFMTTEDPPRPRSDSGHSNSLVSVRRNSYPSVPVLQPLPAAHVSPLASSVPLHPISLTSPLASSVPISLKEPYPGSGSGKRTSAFPSRSPSVPVCQGCQENFESVLNNSLNVSCPRGAKCLLNVNNDLNGFSLADKEASPAFAHKDFEETEGKLQKRRKTKPKVSVKSASQTETPAATATHNGQEYVKKNKPKGFHNKSKSKSERGRSHRKQHSTADPEEPSPLFNLVFQLRVRISQLPIQLLVTSLAESFVSLMGLAVGLLWVFAMLSWEWAQNLLHLLHVWACWGWARMQTLKLDFIRNGLRRLPFLSSLHGGKKSTKTTSANEEFNLPKTGAEAVQRLLQFKETDPYSILGVSSEASDEDIKRSYKSQAILVHPDKNQYAGAEEAFKILASAFELLGNPENRAKYDEEHVLNRPGGQVGQEISDFLEKLKQNIEEAQSILGCQNCGKTHKRYRMDRSASEARYCAACRDRHAAKEGDLWAETSMMGFKWHYYSYLDGAIYDVTEWVTCQPNLVSRVEANTHWVPCRLATPKNKNRNAAFSRMEDLKDLVNDLLNPRQGPGSDAANDPRAAASHNDSKFKARRTGGRRKK